MNEYTFQIIRNGKARRPRNKKIAVIAGVNTIPIIITGMRNIKGILFDNSSNAPITPSVGYILIDIALLYYFLDTT